MAIQIAQTKTGTSTLASTTITWANNTVSGNLIVVAIVNTAASAGNVSTVTDSQGNLYTKVFATENGATTADAEFWYAKNILGGTTPTITVAYTAGVSAAVIAREYSGLDTVTALAQSDGLATGNTNAPTSNTIKITGRSALLIGITGSASTTPSASGNYQNLSTITNTDTIAIEDLYVTSTGSYSATFSDSGTVQWVCGIVAFNEAPHGTTTSTSSTSVSSTSVSTTSSSTSSTSSSTSSTSSSTSSTSTSMSTSSTSISTSSTSSSISSTSSSTSSTSTSSTSSSTSTSSTSSSISSTSISSTSVSSTSSSTSISSTSSSISSTSSSISSTSSSVSSTSFSSTSSSVSTSTTTLPPPNLQYSYQDRLTLVNSAPTIVQSTKYTGTNAQNNFSFTLTSAPTVGNLLIVGIMYYTGDDPFHLPTGWTKESNSESGQVGIAVLSRIVQPGDGVNWNLIVTNIADQNSGAMYEIKGQAATGFINQIANFTNTTSQTSVASASVTPSVLNCLALSFTVTIGSLSGPGITAGWVFDQTISSTFQPGLAASRTALTTDTTTAINNTVTGLTSAQNGTTILLIAPQAALNLPNAFNAVQYGDLSTDDGDYFIERGSEYMIQEYKRTWINNTDVITLTWKGRSTLATTISPILIQIFNKTSGLWETLANITTIPADVDFQVNVTQSTNLSNYYDSNNVVSFRSYQLVI